MFVDRTDAATRLLKKLPPLEAENTLIIALPRGGVPLAAVIADALGASLDVALVRKVGLPGQEELALAAVTDGADPKLSINHQVARYANLSEAQIWELAKRQLTEIDRRRALYLGGREALPVRGKTVVVVDDGIATGMTMQAAVDLLRAQEPARLVVAVPVASDEALAALAPMVDEIVCLETPHPFIAVGRHYRDFGQVPDETVVAILKEHLVQGTGDT